MTVATRPGLVLGTAGATLEGTVITTTAGPRGGARRSAAAGTAVVSLERWNACPGPARALLRHREGPAASSRSSLEGRALEPAAPSARPARIEPPRCGALPPPPLFPSSLASCLALRNRPPLRGGETWPRSRAPV
ncbi:hypothetical protein ES703_82963 [subsurface metagenome]